MNLLSWRRWNVGDVGDTGDAGDVGVVGDTGDTGDAGDAWERCDLIYGHIDFQSRRCHSTLGLVRLD